MEASDNRIRVGITREERDICNDEHSLPRRRQRARAWRLNPLGAAKDWSLPKITKYPDPAIEIVHPSFAKYRQSNAAIERLYTGARWAEGPVWFGDGRYLLFSDIPNNRMLRWLEDTSEVSVFRSPSNYSNGNTRDKQGRLITCEHDSRRVTRTELDGTITVLMDHYQGKPLNAPNDVVVHSNGSIWFSDPGYGIMSNYEGHKAPFELPCNVYRLDPKTGAATVVVGDMRRPNGLCFSPDEKLLYICDTGVTDGPEYPHDIRVYDVVDGARLANGRVFVNMGCGPCRRHSLRCGRQHLGGRRMGRRGLQRRPHHFARRRADRQDTFAGNLRQHLFWRRQARPPVYGREHVALFTLRQHARRYDAIGPLGRWQVVGGQWDAAPGAASKMLRDAR